MSYELSMRQATRSPLKGATYMVWAHFIWWGIFRFVLLWMAMIRLKSKITAAQKAGKPSTKPAPDHETRPDY